MSLWPLGRFCSWLRISRARLSVILLPQSRGFDDGVLGLGVPDGCVVSDARVGFMTVFLLWDGYARDSIVCSLTR